MTAISPHASVSAPASEARTSGRVFNFGAGPSTLPDDVLKQIQQDVWNYRGSGIGILELSHRGKEYDKLIAEIDDDLRAIGNIPRNYKILFMTGGATSQNYIVPANLLPPGGTADHIVTGYWAENTLADARQYASCSNTKATIHVAATSADKNHSYIPADADIKYSASQGRGGPTYVHITSNNTIYGTQWHRLPKIPEGAFLVSDACSDFFWKPIDVTKFGVIYGGAQKNMGTTGCSFIVIRDDILERANKDIPRMLQYGVFSREESRPNTPPTFAIYTVGLMAKWIKAQGGLAALEKLNREKAGLVYAALDANTGFYTPHVRKEDRSFMNITFACKGVGAKEGGGGMEMDARFLADAGKAGLAVLKGHRAMGHGGGMRASLYNAMPLAGAQALAEFIGDFAKKNG
jgi:phosphoserine aminotransferase